MSSFDRIKKLTRQLLPTGRALRMVDEGDKLIEATVEGQSRLFDDITSTLFAILADNDNFTEQDATEWEIRLGMIVSTGLDLETRKEAILRKYNHPGTIEARQSADYVEGQLQDAGFVDVFVHENVNNLSIEQILTAGESALIQLGDAQLGDNQLGNPFSFFSSCLTKLQLGNVQLGSPQLGSTNWCDKIANNIDVSLDEFFFIGPNNRTFVIGGAIFGTFGEIEAIRTDEFRQLVLRIKPVNSIAFLLINYI